ncbi:TlpA family protein disulfide reductase [Thiocystis violacea]|uniref:TlpA family protein disulfide reductase n=1 Tax=Thiocystis violacea TaxID=13725 RepID=UPI001905FA73|nr:TlpA disulfide reductase family protein [Thiocystis violacea]MBK1718068.1 alkyl hydroperoxide reductase [Thiocystis violacea]
MKPFKVVMVTILAGGISIGAAIVGQRLVNDQTPRVDGLTERHPEQLQTLPDFRLSDLDGHEIASNAWAGKILVLNFWATWCDSCIDEMPTFIRAQEAMHEAGVQFVGIAVDRVEDVRDFIVERPVNYPLLIATPEVLALSKQLGNRLEVLPFTVIFDRHGRRVHSQIGEMEAEDLQARIDRLTGTASAEL